MKKRMALVAGLAALLAGATAVTAGEAVDITYAGGLLTVRCKRAALGAVLEQIGTATGMTLRVDDAVRGTVLTADIEAQPVQIAVEQLLEGRGVSYAMSLSPDGRGVAQMFVGTDADKSVASTGAGRALGAAVPAAPPRRSPAPAAAHGPIAMPAPADDDDEVDAEPDDPSPFAGLPPDSVPGLPVVPPTAVTGATGRPAVIDSSGRPVTPPAIPAPPQEQKPLNP